MTLSFALLATRAFSNSADTTVQDGAAAGGMLSAAKATRLKVEKEDLALRCDSWQCQFTATYVLANPHDEAISTRALFIGQLGEAKIDGKSVVEKLEKADSKRVELLRERYEVGCGRNGEEDPMAALRLRVPAKSKAKLVMKGTIRLDVDETPYLDVYGIPGPWARHLGAFLITAAKRRYASGCYDLWPIATWQGEPKIHVTASWPEDDDEVTLIHRERPRDGVERSERERIFDPASDGKRRVAKATIEGRSAGTLRTLQTNGKRQLDVVTVGALAGVGARTGRAFGALHRYAAAVTFKAFFSASAGVDFVDGERAPFRMLEAHTPSLWLIIPSLSLGVGGQKQPDSRWGPRFSFGLQWPLFGLQTTFDPGPEKSSTYALTFSL